MRTSRGSGIYPVHESDEMQPTETGIGAQMSMTVIKPR